MNVTKHNFRGTCLWLSAVALLLVTACAQQLASVPIPSTARNVQQHSLNKEATHQVDFDVSVTYPDSSIAQFYRNVYGKKGWQVCKDTGDWIEVIHRIGLNNYSPTRQKLEYLTSPHKNKLLLVMLRYIGRNKQNSAQVSNWNDRVQHVTVVLYDLKNGGRELSSICN